jgi:hypothetical protein
MNKMIFILILVVLIYIPIGIKGCSVSQRIREKVKARQDYYDNLHLELKK